VRAIAEAWNIDAEEAVTIMEPLYLEGDRDLRPRLEAVDGEAIRVTAIRMRNPLVKDSQI
jgi:hypothetical protein